MEEDQIASHSTPPVENSIPPVQPEAKVFPTGLFLVVSLLIILAGAAGFTLGKFSSTVQPLPSPVATASPSPASMIEGWENYKSAYFTLDHPADFKISFANDDIKSDVPNTLLTLEKQKSFPDSHLTTRHIFQVQMIPNLTTPETCYVLSSGGTPLVKSKTINGEIFYYSDKYGGVAAGTHDTHEEYKVFKNNTCYELDLIFIESSDWNGPNDLSLAAADGKEAFPTLSQILSTFKFLE